MLFLALSLKSNTHDLLIVVVS